MSDNSQMCPKCDCPMEQGFIVDMGHGTRLVSHWARGAPLKSLLFGTWVPADALPVGTFRCRSCGYLESYARSEFGSQRRNQFSLRSLFIVTTAIAAVLGLAIALLRTR
jgi:hypothetical protein